MPSGSSPGREQRHMVLGNIQGLVSRVRMSVPDNCLNVLGLGKCSLHDRLTLIELRQVLTSECAEVESREAETHWLRE